MAADPTQIPTPSVAPVDTTVQDKISVVPMRRRHLRAVTVIENEVNPHPWSLSLFSGELRMPASRAWIVATEGYDVLGFAGLMVVHEEGHITNLAVHPNHQRRQVASRMLADLLDDAVDRGVEDVTLEVRSSNGAAQALYAGFGFAPGGVRRGYYQNDKEDAIIMWANGIGSDLERTRRVDIRRKVALDSAGGTIANRTSSKVGEAK